MQIQYFNTFLVPQVSVLATTNTLVLDTSSLGSASVRNRTIVEIPLQGITGTINFLVLNGGVTPGATDVQNYGVQFTSADKVAIINCSPQQAIWAYSSSANTLYIVEKF